MRLTSTGLGIGTSTMGRRLNVAGPTAAGIQFQPTGASGRNYSIFATDSGASVVGALAVFDDTASAYRMIIDSSGNLGLGVTPSAWGGSTRALELQYYNTVAGGDDATRVYMAIGSNFYEAVAGTQRYKVTNANIPASMYKQRDGVHSWYYAPNGTAGNVISFTTQMQLEASGNLYLGTSGGSGKHIAINSDLSTTGAFLYNDTGQTILSACAAVPMIFRTSNTERARIDSSGNLLVGTTSASIGNTSGSRFIDEGRTLNITNTTATNPSIVTNQVGFGGVTVSFRYSNSQQGYIETTSTAVLYITTSDYRLKNTITPMTGALAKVALLKPCTYKWNADGSDGQGFIAHELAEVCPQAVSGEKDAVDADGNIKSQGIDTSFLVATLTAAIQEQQAIIESLKARLDAANL